MNINWYPGHMAKTKRIISESLKSIDIIAEIVDARIPLASKNPDIERLTSQKPRLLILNKSDLASVSETKKWMEYYKSKGYFVVQNNSLRTNVNDFYSAIKILNKEKAEKNLLRGIKNTAVNIMILGIPNVGKSTFINSLSGEKKAKTADKPGVTRGKQWVNLSGGVSLLDMPGILWPKLDNQHVAANLAITGAIKDTILDIEEIAIKLIDILANNYEKELKTRYKLEGELNPDSYEVLKDIGKKRGFVISGGKVDTERTAIVFIDEFRAGKIGRISLEKVSVVKPEKAADNHNTIKEKVISVENNDKEPKDDCGIMNEKDDDEN